ncbi:hypothetical protein D3C78_805470 [compost metagenome]
MRSIPGMARVTGVVRRVALVGVFGDREGCLDGIAGGLVVHEAAQFLIASGGGLRVPAPGGGNGQGVLLLVEAAAGCVDTDVAGCAIAGVSHARDVRSAQVVRRGIAPLLDSGVGLGAAKDELLIGGGNCNVVGLLVHVAGGHVGANVAAAFEGVFNGGAVFGPDVGGLGVADVLIAACVGSGVASVAVQQGVAIMVATTRLVCLGRDRHCCSHGEYQRFQSH